MCQHRVIWKNRETWGRRQHAKGLLKGLATLAPDVFQHRDVRAVINQVIEKGDSLYEWLTCFNFLRARGFIGVVDRTPKGRARNYCLTEQAIRWLDWAGFDWKAA